MWEGMGGCVAGWRVLRCCEKMCTCVCEKNMCRDVCGVCMCMPIPYLFTRRQLMQHKRHILTRTLHISILHDIPISRTHPVATTPLGTTTVPVIPHHQHHSGDREHGPHRYL